MTLSLRFALFALAMAIPCQAALAFTPTIRFSEFLSDAPGPDDGREFFEISGPAGSSLDGLTILEIDGDGDAGGNIDGVFDLTGLTLGSNGLLLLRDQEEILIGETPVPGVLNPAPAPDTNVYYENNIRAGDFNNNGTVDAADFTVWRDAMDGNATMENDLTPSGVGSDDYDTWVENFGLTRAFFNRSGDIENGSITYALVRDFTGSLDMDLDAEDDGVLNATPWSEVLDAVGFNEGAGPEGTALNNSYAEEMGGIEFNGTEDGIEPLPGLADEPDGYVLLQDGMGGFIPTAFDPDESNEGGPELFFDSGGTLQLIDTAPLGPWGVDSALTRPEMVAFNSEGELVYVDAETTLITGELIGAPGLDVFGEDGQSISLYLVSPGNVNVTATLGELALPPEEAIATPEPTTLSLLAIALAASRRRRR
ncbi:hypothetical protein Mal64_39370 [Pseudobythopirellula maris]|uniref:PEP-CTERM protein-sorting domain-containing protein n=1 Tax=Pseudobythopirellula maris TaxID=2527991 RepID=A0A5C5ZFN8_9BACT|nr:PEP-CTERM sorting domain-containing protein [Pseudobythopirellula maris]TWT86194.1 hypothetical protein Mal64_39370 [Pseudobythopirellula maris]